jgi:hypothetical protein
MQAKNTEQDYILLYCTYRFHSEAEPHTPDAAPALILVPAPFLLSCLIFILKCEHLKKNIYIFSMFFFRYKLYHTLVCKEKRYIYSSLYFFSSNF